MEFKQLSPADVDAAYALVREAFEWLKRKDLPRWLVPYESYSRRQAAGENYGLVVDHVLRAVVTLTAHYPRSGAHRSGTRISSGWQPSQVHATLPGFSMEKFWSSWQSNMLHRKPDRLFTWIVIMVTAAYLDTMNSVAISYWNEK